MCIWHSIEVIFLKLHTTLFPRMRQNNGFYLENRVAFLLHLGFKRSDFLEATYIEIPKHALQTM
jgi:hypothetical protein